MTGTPASAAASIAGPDRLGVLGEHDQDVRALR